MQRTFSAATLRGSMDYKATVQALGSDNAVKQDNGYNPSPVHRIVLARHDDKPIEVVTFSHALPCVQAKVMTAGCVRPMRTKRQSKH